MKSLIRTLAFIIPCSIFNSGSLHAQERADISGKKEYNLDHFLSPVKANASELAVYSSGAVKNHPEFGILPFDAPCDDCTELIDKRSGNSRYFIKNGTDGKGFYLQTAMHDLHYKNENGELITIDPNLVAQPGVPGVYNALQQPNPTILNMPGGYTSIKMADGAELRFNQSLKSYFTDDFKTFDHIQLINRESYTVGAEGSNITEAFEGVDQQLIFTTSSIKSNYIVKDVPAVNMAGKFYVIEDEFLLPEGYSISYNQYDGHHNAFDFWHGELLIVNALGITMATVKAPMIYDNNPERNDDENMHDVIGYTFEQQGELCKIRMIVQANWLRSSERVYPVTIDPEVFGEMAEWTGVQGTDYFPALCSNTLSVMTPTAAMLTGATISWEFSTSFAACGGACRLDDILVKFTTDCGYSPEGGEFFWVCVGCNFAGTWFPTISADNTSSLVTCYEPSCEAYPIDFVMEHSQLFCNTPGTCVSTCAYLRKYQVTIAGESIITPEVCNALDDDCNAVVDDGIVETVTIEAGGPTTFCQGGNVLLSATHSGTSVQWRKNGSDIPGATLSAYTANKPGNYTAITTSACDTATSDIITVIVNKNPPANIIAGGPTSFCMGGSVVLSANAGAGLSYQWYKGATPLAGATSINYTATLPGNYKCRVTKTATGCLKNSNSIMVSVPCRESDEFNANQITLSPSPAKDKLTVSIHSFSAAHAILIIADLSGKQIEQHLTESAVTELDISNLASGMYLVRIMIDGKETVQEFIKQE